MTSDDFWNKDSELFFCYMRAYEQKARIIDSDNFSLGTYFLLALQQVMHNSFSKTSKTIFPKTPFLADEKTKQRVEQMEMEKRIMAQVSNINTYIRKKKESNNGG